MFVIAIEECAIVYVDGFVVFIKYEIKADGLL